MTGDKTKEDPNLQKFTDYLERTGRRNTTERRAVFEAARVLGRAFDAEELAARVTEAGVRMSLATVYNNLALMVDAGVMARFNSLGGCLYQMLPCNRHILVCLRCNKVKAVKNRPFAEVLRARHYSAFTAAYYEMTVYGVCSACARKARKSIINSNTEK